MSQGILEKTRVVDPVSRVVDLDLPSPSLSDNRGHEARLRAGLLNVLGEDVLCPLRVARMLSSLPSWGYQVSVLLVDGPCGWEVADLAPSGKMPHHFGLAIDLGSTSVVFSLVDLASGEVIQTVSRMNPQRAHGEDILDRILFAGRPGGLDTLQGEVLDLVRETMRDLARSAGISEGVVTAVTLAGNTTMTHLFFGLDPTHICREPYLPVVNVLDPVPAQELGLPCHSGAYVYAFPNVGSYFGGDLLAGIVASGMHAAEEISILVDVGTNAEVVLGNRDWLVACAGAAGPALEGGILSCGVTARPGAIERVKIDPKTLRLECSTIGEGRPNGLCGSGIIDLLAALFRAGLVEPTGRLVTDRDPARMREIQGEAAYVVAFEDETADGRPVFITQGDIKNLIRSKAAMYTILEVVTESVGIGFDDIERFYVAGTFGSYIDPLSAVTIGMLPDIPLERFIPLGNSALAGAIRFLLDRTLREELARIRERITYLEMNVRGDFMAKLTAALFLPHTDLGRFPGVRTWLNKI
ncbi:MAG: ASKHA domain-containing protein [Deltaproteobacteria bacterium]